MNVRNLLLPFVLAVSGVLLSSSARASLTCDFVSVADVAFANYDVFNVSSSTKATGSITFQCKKLGGPQFMTIDLSAGNSGTYFSRTMRQGVDTLTYNLYLDAANTQVWGDGSGGTSEFGPFDPTDKKNQVVTIYAAIPPGQDARVGAYADSITATINF
jgi:spore coat protein U-like protein